MIIKYYNNGWNYIDEVENVQWINKTVEKTDAKLEEAVGGRIYVSTSEMEMTILKSRVDSELYNQLKLFEVVGAELFSKIDYENMQRVLKQDGSDYVRVIMYDKDEIRKAVAFTHSGYLLNNNGQTIEKLG